MSELPSGWMRTRAADCVDVRVSNVDKKSVPNQPAVRLCNYMDVYAADYLDVRSTYMHATATHTEIAKFGLQPGDVVITKDSETPDDIGVPVLVDSIHYGGPPLVCGYHLAVLRPGGSVDPSFLAKQLAHTRVRAYFAKEAVGTTRYGLSNGAIGRVPLWLPSRLIQKRVGEILRTLDEAISATAALIAKLEQVKKGLLHDLLTCGIDDNGEVRDLERHPWQFKDSPLGRIPKRWRIAALGELGEVLNGTTPSRGRADFWGGPIPWLSSAKVNEYRVQTPSEYITRRALAQCSLQLLPVGTVIVGMIGQGKTRGMSARIEIEATINQNIGAVVPGPEVDSVFCHLYLHQQYGRLRGGGRGSNQEALNCSLLATFPIVAPPLYEQKALGARVRTLETRMDSESAMLMKLRAIKAGLMDDLLTGRVRMATAEETP